SYVLVDGSTRSSTPCPRPRPTPVLTSSIGCRSIRKHQAHGWPPVGWQDLPPPTTYPHLDEPGANTLSLGCPSTGGLLLSPRICSISSRSSSSRWSRASTSRSRSARRFSRSSYAC